MPFRLPWPTLRNVFRQPFKRYSSSSNNNKSPSSVKRAMNVLTNPGPPLLSRYWYLHTLYLSVKYGLAFVLTAHIFVDYFYAIHGTWGISMVPTLAASGDRVIISKYYRHGRHIKVGDIVSFRHPLRPDLNASKRVIGLPGDFVLRDTPEQGEGVLVRVPQGHCWVVGDNLRHSRDSRMFGPLPLALVKGKIVGIYKGFDLFPEWCESTLVDVHDDMMDLGGLADE